MVLITALIGDLSRRYGSAVDVLTSGPWSAPLLRGQPGVGEVLSVRSRKTPYWLSPDQQRAVRRLRARGVGPTWFCDGNEAARPMLARAGITPPFIVDVQQYPLLAGEHATQQWRRLARIDPAVAGLGEHGSLGGEVGSGAGGCHLEVGKPQHAELESWLQRRGMAGVPLLAVQVGNKRTMRRGLRRLAVNSKHWPNERWAAVLRHLRRRHAGHAIVLLGTGPEYGLNAEVARLAGVERVYNVADDLPIARLLALLARVEGLVTVDSGPAHAAAAVDCPQVVLFGKASMSLYRPWGTGGADVSALSGVVDGQASMLGIESAAVIAAWDCLRLRPARAAYPG